MLLFIKPKKLKVLTILFLSTGGIGIAIGLLNYQFMITVMGVVNLSLGGFFGWRLLTQEPELRKKRNK